MLITGWVEMYCLTFSQASPHKIAETVDLLLQLKEPEQELYEQYLSK